MKVISEGPEWRIQITCTGHGNGGEGCGAVLEAGRDDLRYFSEREGYCRIMQEQVVVKCPLCGITTDLPKTDWPPRRKDLEPWTGKWRDEKATTL